MLQWEVAGGQAAPWGLPLPSREPQRGCAGLWSSASSLSGVMWHCSPHLRTAQKDVIVWEAEDTV